MLCHVTIDNAVPRRRVYQRDSGRHDRSLCAVCSQSRGLDLQVQLHPGTLFLLVRFSQHRPVRRCSAVPDHSTRTYFLCPTPLQHWYVVKMITFPYNFVRIIKKPFLTYYMAVAGTPYNNNTSFIAPTCSQVLLPKPSVTQQPPGVWRILIKLL